jgi:agmatinase
LKAIAVRADVIGFDFVEVNPQLDVGTGVTCYLGAHTVIEFLGHICDQPRWAARHHKRGTHKPAKRRPPVS